MSPVHAFGHRGYRREACLLLIVCSSWSLGQVQGFPGTKTDPAGSASSVQSAGAGLGPLFNVLVALGIVYALIRFALPKVMAKLNKRLVTSTGSPIRIEESASFAGGSLYVVSARGKTLLLAAGAQGVQCLSDLTEAVFAPPPETFGEMVERELSASSKAAVNVENPASQEIRQTQPEGEWTAALERLERIAG